MKRLLLPLLAALLFPTSVNANVDPEVHKLCLPAADYLGCVRAITGNSNSIEVITNPGTATTKGNSCPVGYAYIGQGYCREVLCSAQDGNTEMLGGKKWKCGMTIMGRLVLRLGDELRIGNDPACPSGQPEIGWTSTCESPYLEPAKKDRTLGRRPK
tara:strand:+ start:210 stop:680 length:471 start_codon:yes stop_codon:yes gene_type:complete